MLFWKYTYIRTKSVMVNVISWEPWRRAESAEEADYPWNCVDIPDTPVSPSIIPFPCKIVSWLSCKPSAVFTCHLWKPVLDSKLLAFWRRLVFSPAHVCIWIYLCVYIFLLIRIVLWFKPGHQARPTLTPLTQHKWHGGDNQESSRGKTHCFR